MIKVLTIKARLITRKTGVYKVKGCQIKVLISENTVTTTCKVTCPNNLSLVFRLRSHI